MSQKCWLVVINMFGLTMLVVLESAAISFFRCECVCAGVFKAAIVIDCNLFEIQLIRSHSAPCNYLVDVLV